MAVSTTQSIIRSGGGDQTRVAYCGSANMTAGFYIPGTNASGDPVQASSTNTSPVVLPPNSVILSIAIQPESTGIGETFNLGYSDAQASSDNVILNGVPADVAATFQTGSAGTNATGQIGVFSKLSTITGGGTLTGALYGWITYFVQDPLAGQQNV